MKGFFGEVFANIKNNSKSVFKVLSTTFFVSLLASTVMVLKYPTFFKQKAANVNIAPAEIQIARMGAEEISKSVGGFNSEILMSEKQDKMDKNTVSKKDIQVDLKNKQDKSVERRKYMKDLIKKDTSKFLQNAVPNKVISKLDPKIKNNFEQETTIEGSVETIIGENIEKQVAEIETYINTDKDRLRVYSLDQKDKGIRTGTKVKVKGFKLDKDLATESIVNNRIDSKVKGAANTVVSGNKRLAVVLFNFQNKSSDFWPKDEIKKWLFTDPASLNEYYKEVSYGNLSFSGDVFGPVTVPFSAEENCGSVYEPSMAAKEMVKATGVDLDGYDYVAFDFPAYNSCWAGAWADIGGRYTWFNEPLLNYDSVLPTKAPTTPGTTPAPYYPAMTRVGLVIHEIGHNLGMYHANSFECKDLTGAATTLGLIKKCTNMEYGDLFDVMGTHFFDPRHVNNYHKGQMGWLPESLTLTTEGSGDFKLHPIESSNFSGALSANSYEAIRIPAGIYSGYSNGNVFYYLEYRKKVPGIFDQFEESDPVVQGVTIRLGFDYPVATNSFLLDVTPERYTINDSTIKLGQVYNDDTRGIKITVKDVDANGDLNIRIDRFTPICIRNVPDIYFESVYMWSKPGEPTDFFASITNNDMPGCGPSTFSIIPSLPNGWEQQSVNSEITINPQETKSINLTIVPAGNSPQGAYNISENFKHSAGSQYDITRSSLLNIYHTDSGGPIINVSSPLDGGTYERGVIDIAANITDETLVTYAAASLDNIDVICSWTNSPYSCRYDFSNLSLGTYTLRFYAYDAFNNMTEKAMTFQIIPKAGATPSPSPTPFVKAGDVNRDGKVNIIDIGIVIDNYGVRPIPNPQADLNNDGVANIVDIGIIIDNYKI